jgi:hypothetical protein
MSALKTKVSCCQNFQHPTLRLKVATECCQTRLIEVSYLIFCCFTNSKVCAVGLGITFHTFTPSIWSFGHLAIRRCLTLLDATRRYSTLLDATQRCSTLLDAARRYLTLLDAVRRCSTLLDAT